MLRVNPLFVSDETRIVQERLEKPCSASESDLLIHVLNISIKKKRCAYYGRFFGRNSDENTRDRCLAPEIDGARSSIATCPFYNPDLENKCSYQHNRR